MLALFHFEGVTVISVQRGHARTRGESFESYPCVEVIDEFPIVAFERRDP